MIRTSLLYPHKEGARFDFDYYFNKHLPFVKKSLGDAMKHLSVDKGIAGAGPDAPPPFLVSAFMTFESVEAFQNAFGPHATAIFADIPNFTDVQPVATISEIVYE